MSKIPRQIQISRFILSFIKENGYPPTIADIRKAVKLKSTSTVWYHLDKLGLAKDWVHEKEKLVKGTICPTCLRRVKKVQETN